MPRRMSTPEWRRFVSEGARTAKLAIVLEDGTPHVTPVWFTLDDGDVLFTTTASTRKARAIAREPHVALCVDRDERPLSYVSVRGLAEVTDDPDTVGPWLERILARYGETQPSYSDLGSGPDRRLLIRVRPDRVTALAFDD